MLEKPPEFVPLKARALTVPPASDRPPASRKTHVNFHRGADCGRFERSPSKVAMQ